MAMQPPNRRRRRCSGRRSSLGLLIGVLAGLVLAGCGGGSAALAPTEASQAQSTSTPQADPHGKALTELRTVVLRTGEISPSPPGSVLHTRLMTGAMPADRTTAVVLSDEDCEPDAAGVSHCRNGLLLADGKRLVVRHYHSMSTVPCLSPGEEVTVLPS
jgi:hypothetical protein